MPEDETLCFVLEDEEGNEKEYEWWAPLKRRERAI